MFKQLPEFDELVKLARENPSALDDLLVEHTEDVISKAPEEIQSRLRGLQFQIDSQRKIQGKGIKSCIKISEMMQDSLLKLNAALNGKETEENVVAPAKILRMNLVNA